MIRDAGGQARIREERAIRLATLTLLDDPRVTVQDVSHTPGSGFDLLVTVTDENERAASLAVEVKSTTRKPRKSPDGFHIPVMLTSIERVLRTQPTCLLVYTEPDELGFFSWLTEPRPDGSLVFNPERQFEPFTRELVGPILDQVISWNTTRRHQREAAVPENPSSVAEALAGFIAAFNELERIVTLTTCRLIGPDYNIGERVTRRLSCESIPSLMEDLYSYQVSSGVLRAMEGIESFLWEIRHLQVKRDEWVHGYREPSAESTIVWHQRGNEPIPKSLQGITVSLYEIQAETTRAKHATSFALSWFAQIDSTQVS